MSKEEKKSGLSRRDFMKGLGVGVIGTSALISSVSKCAPEKPGPHGSVIRGPGKEIIVLTINREKMVLEVEPRTTLLDALRDQLGFTGSKRVCDRGQCGACTVIMNGETVLACTMLAVDAEGTKIETVEGLADGDKLHPVQESFVQHDAMQCGFCSPGFIMSSVALLRSNANPTWEEIKHGVSGNLCRCGTYPHIFVAVDEAAKKMRKGG
jgi:xanthine dehydrogenase YagT iron-sulfur-binding subunit